MNNIFKTKNLLAGLQWFFFIFANIVIIPITVGEVFELNQNEVVSLLQMSFIVTGLACLAQAFIGHRRPILEGQSGLVGYLFDTCSYFKCARYFTSYIVTLGSYFIMFV